MHPALLSWMHDFAAQGILLTDDNLIIQSCNVWLEKQIKSKEGELFGRSLLDIFPELRTRGFDRYYHEALKGQSRVLSHRLHRYLLPMPPIAGGGAFAQMQQSARISPLVHEGQIIGTVTVIDDVTERVVRETELSIQLEERERLLASELAARQLAETNSRIKDEFLAAVSHEIRAPLNAITGWTQLLLNGDLDEDKTRHAFETIQRNVRSQAQIIEDLLDVSRIVAGQMRLDLQPINLTESIETSVQNVSPTAAAKNIDLIKSTVNASVFVMGDAGRLQQILWNLLSNAVKFTPPHGRVEIILREVDGFAELSIRDDGEGISDEFLPHIFDRFRQADGSSKRKQGGLGLGLSIVKNLVEMHGGTITASSSGVGTGSDFTVMLPLLMGRKSGAEVNGGNRPSRDRISENISGCRILIVEDDRDSREMLRILLEGLDAETRTAANALEALTQISRFKPDVLISDLGMPDIDGYDLIRQIRSLSPENGGQTPAIALTGFVGPDEMKRVHSAGFNQHLSKPVEYEKLVNAINNIRNHFRDHARPQEDTSA